jgi:hypothetical protein
MSKTNAWENDLLKLLFTNSIVSAVGDANGLRPSTGTGALFLSLHTADPGEAGVQNSSEISYTSYARVSVARNATNFLVSANTVALAFNQDFPTSTGGATTTAAFFGIGCETGTGATKLLYKGALSPVIVINTGVTPRINAGDIVTEE